MRTKLSIVLFRQNAKVKKLAKEVQSLRQENNVKRVPTSVTIKDLIDYVMQHEEDDPLLKPRGGFTLKDNCSII